MRQYPARYAFQARAPHLRDNALQPRFLPLLSDVNRGWYILFAFTPSFHSPQRALEADQSRRLPCGTHALASEKDGTLPIACAARH